MGFSLQTFFDEAIEIIESRQNTITKYKKLIAHIKWGYTYAKQCGALK